jgi:hypothetical protein
MEILKHPLRNALPIPWEKVNMLHKPRHVALQNPINASPGPSIKRKLDDVDCMPGSQTEKGAGEKGRKRRKTEKKRYIEIDDNGNDNEDYDEEIRTKMKELHVEVCMAQYEFFHSHSVRFRLLRTF